MSSRIYLNIFLTVLAITLILVLQLDSYQQDSTVPDRLTNVSPDSINTIGIIRQGKEDLYFTKTTESWRIISPVQARASRIRVYSILSLLQSPVYAQIPSDSRKLVSYGLATPGLSLQLNEMKFQFGGISALDDRRYIKNGDSVFLIEDILYPQLLQDAGFFVATNLFEVALKSVHFSCTNNTGTVLEQDGTNETLTAWEKLDAISVTSTAPQLQKYAEVRIETIQNDLLRLTIYMDAGDLILKPSDHSLYYLIPGDYAGELGIPLSSCVMQNA